MEFTCDRCGTRECYDSFTAMPEEYAEEDGWFLSRSLNLCYRCRDFVESEMGIDPDFWSESEELEYQECFNES